MTETATTPTPEQQAQERARKGVFADIAEFFSQEFTRAERYAGLALTSPQLHNDLSAIFGAAAKGLRDELENAADVVAAAPAAPAPPAAAPAVTPPAATTAEGIPVGAANAGLPADQEAALRLLQLNGFSVTRPGQQG